ARHIEEGIFGGPRRGAHGAIDDREVVMTVRRFAAVTILGALMGCQAILGIEEGKPRPDGGHGGESASARASGDSSSSSGSDGGRPGTVLLLAGSTTGITACTLHPPATTWSTTMLAGTTLSGFGLGVLSTGEGIGLMRYSKPGDALDNALM